MAVDMEYLSALIQYYGVWKQRNIARSATCLQQNIKAHSKDYTVSE